MFDSYHIQEGPDYPQKIKIKENRAPTDESIKIYRDMVEKARQEVVDGFTVQGNFLGRVVMFARPSDPNIVFFFFELNGQRYTIRLDKVILELTKNEGYSATRAAILKGIKDAVADVLALEIGRRTQR